MALRSWTADRPDPRLPPDLCRNQGSTCVAIGDHSYICTRSAGHTGRHAAGTGRYIVAVWP
jgi:hypothetical protein